MDMSAIAARLGLSGSRPVIRKAGELRRLCDVNFDSSVLGIGEVCKAIICLEIAASKFQVIFDRAEAVRMSGMSEKAYIRSFNALQNGLGVKTTLDVRELGIQFGCVRLIPFVQKGLSLYKERFLAALPPSRRASTDFGRPVFTAAAFYLCAKRHKLKVDKLKLIDLCGTSSTEFTTVSTSMADLCFDVFGIAKEKKDPKSIKGNRELLNVLPSKRKHEDDSDSSDDESSEDDQDELDLPTHKRQKKMEKQAYNEWKSSVLSSNKQTKTDPAKPRRQAQLNFKKPADIAVEVPSAAN
ncbi:origin of replication complex subunit 6 [Panicum miliaceum]|uniref:Origin of replication complex subunit 6 n=1 Tax=Panicum miliaceum TaxID=4540 RepID=A0A3L6T6U2_PANMI|nr:origin of replication complex subunit 6 [Panicum miliaceum]